MDGACGFGVAGALAANAHHTDGIYEAENRLGHEFGTSRVIEVIERLADQSAQAIVDGIFNAVQTFREGEAVADDMTAVAMRITN